MGLIALVRYRTYKLPLARLLIERDCSLAAETMCHGEFATTHIQFLRELKRTLMVSYSIWSFSRDRTTDS